MILKKCFAFFFTVCIIGFIGLFFDNSSDLEPGDKAIPGISTEVPISKEAAVAIAREEVLSFADKTKNDRWTKESEVVAAFPIFIDGIEGVSYYECKIKTNGADAGYVLVNTNFTDIIIPESAPEGSTLTESYRAKIGSENFMILRYDWFRSAAVEKEYDLANSCGKILASSGFENTAVYKDDFQESFIEKYRAAVQSKKCFPMYSSKQIQEYYKNPPRYFEEMNRFRPFWSNYAWAAKYRKLTAELKHTLPNLWHTPQWHQITKSNGYPIGCGNTAWAIVYGYWAAFKGKKRLFNGHDIKSNCKPNDSNDTPIKACMKECARYTKTSDVKGLKTVSKGGAGKGKKNGRTWPWNICKGTKYAKKRGYKNTSCERDRGTEYSKFSKVKKYIAADKPCILLIHNDGVGGGNHYVVIEAACKSQKKYAWKWHNRDVKYLVNFGHGTTYDGGKSGRRWIYVRDWGKNQHKRYSSFSVFLINVK